MATPETVRTLMASDFIKALQALVDQHGDKPLLINGDEDFHGVGMPDLFAPSQYWAVADAFLINSFWHDNELAVATEFQERD